MHIYDNRSNHCGMKLTLST